MIRDEENLITSIMLILDYLDLFHQYIILHRKIKEDMRLKISSSEGRFGDILTKVLGLNFVFMAKITYSITESIDIYDRKTNEEETFVYVRSRARFQTTYFSRKCS